MQSLGKVYIVSIDFRIVCSIINGTRYEKEIFIKTYFGLPFLSSNEVDNKKKNSTKSIIYT